MYQPVSSRVAGYLTKPTAEYDTCAVVQRLAAIIHRPPHVVANAVIVFTGSVLALNPSGYAPVLSQLLTFVPGLWGTFKCWRVDPSEPDLARKWLDYWIIYSACVAVDSCSRDYIGELFPLWWLTKVGGLYWMLGKHVQAESVEKLRPESAKKYKPKPLTLKVKKTKPSSVTRRPPTPIAEARRIIPNEPLPTSALGPPELLHFVPLSVEPDHPGPIGQASSSPVRRAASGMLKGKSDHSPETSPSPPFELSSDGSDDQPKGDFYFDDLATAVEPIQQSDFTSPRLRGTPAQTPVDKEVEPENSPDALPRADPPVPVAVKHSHEDNASTLVITDAGSGRSPTIPFAKPDPKDPMSNSPADPSGANRQLEVANADLEASLDDILKFTAREDEELMRTGDEEEVTKGGTKPLSVFERRVRRHNTLSEAP